MTIEALCARESDFSDFVQFADEMELLRQREILRTELKKFESTRSRATDLMRDRLDAINRNLGLAIAA